MHESECDIELTPKRIEKCRIDSKQLCDIQTNEILIGEWLVGEWTNNCDLDICSSETRQVYCNDINSICDVHTRPVSEKKCDLPFEIECGSWKSEAWSEVNFIFKFSLMNKKRHEVLFKKNFYTFFMK